MPYDKNNKWVKSPSRTAPTNHVRPGTSKLIKDDDMRGWLMLQKWSDFAQSLYDYCLNNGGFTEKQLMAAEKLRIKVDSTYDPYGKGIWEGVYIDDEDKYIFKISIVTKNNNEQVRSIRKRLIDMPGWSDIKLASNKALLFGHIKAGTYRMLNDDELVDIGRRTGICCDCGKVLDNPKSIAAGIGPYCAKMRSQSNQ